MEKEYGYNLPEIHEPVKQLTFTEPVKDKKKRRSFLKESIF